jgi:hypothetical protein
VLDADTDTLLNVTISDALIDDDPEGRLGNIEDNPGLSTPRSASGQGKAWRKLPVVIFVGHALVDRAVCLDIHQIAHLVVGHEGGELQLTLGTKVFGEHVASASTITVRVWHCEGFYQKSKVNTSIRVESPLQ